MSNSIGFNEWQASARSAFEQGLAFELAGEMPQAFTQFQRATQLDPANGPAWRHLGNLLRRMGELGAASACFERAIAQGDDRPLNEFFLSAIGIGEVVPLPPATFVTALFDQYAERFDGHLLNDLHYRAPPMLAELIGRRGREAHGAVLDLGCGTGLAGQHFRGRCDALTGVDLSSEMADRALRERHYDDVVIADIASYLKTARPASFDLVLCCDTMIYTGDLADIFAGVSRVLKSGGSFGFTIETCEADSGFDLLPSLRYAHSERYVRRLAQEHGLAFIGLQRGSLREEDGQPVEGLAMHLERG